MGVCLTACAASPKKKLIPESEDYSQCTSCWFIFMIDRFVYVSESLFYSNGGRVFPSSVTTVWANVPSLWQG